MSAPRPSRPLRWVVLASAALAAQLVAGRARANPLGYHEHDGFYLRLAGGASALAVSRSTEQVGPGTSAAFAGGSSRLGGTSVFSEVSLGGTPLPGLVLAGTLLWHGLPSPELRQASGARLDLGNTLVFALLGATVDFYPRVGRGFHVGGGVGLATAAVNVADPAFSSIGGLGVGGTTSLGYDLWIGDDWSFGVLSRFAVAYVESSQRSGVQRAAEHDTVAAATLALSFLYH